MKFEIDLTEREIMYLKQYAEIFTNERDNDITSNPIIVVENRIDLAVDGRFGSDKQKYVISDCCNANHYECDDLDDMRKYLEESYDDILEGFLDGIINNFEDGDTEFTIKEIDFYIVDTQTIYEPVAYFLTRKEAEKYVIYQGHNLRNPRIYTRNDGYSNNGDLNCLNKLLLNIGKKLNDFDNTNKVKDDTNKAKSFIRELLDNLFKDELSYGYKLDIIKMYDNIEMHENNANKWYSFNSVNQEKYDELIKDIRRSIEIKQIPIKDRIYDIEE